MGTDFMGCFVRHRLFHETKNARSRTKHDRALNVCKRQVPQDPLNSNGAYFIFKSTFNWVISLNCKINEDWRRKTP